MGVVTWRGIDAGAQPAVRRMLVLELAGRRLGLVGRGKVWARVGVLHDEGRERSDVGLVEDVAVRIEAGDCAVEAGKEVGGVLLAGL